MAERCLTRGLPEFGGGTGSFRRIVQTPGGISIFYDVGQGQGWQRNIVMDGSPHLPANIRQWYGDSRGHWEGDTLVIDVTNFSPKTDVFGSRENLHLVERWTRTGPKTLAYEVTMEDPTVWTRPWTVKQEFGQAERQGKPAFIPSRAASKEIRAFRACCRHGAWKSSLSRRDAAPTPPPGPPVTSRRLLHRPTFHRIVYSNPGRTVLQRVAVEARCALRRSRRKEFDEVIDDLIRRFLLQVVAGREWLCIDEIACELAPHRGIFLRRRRSPRSP